MPLRLFCLEQDPGLLQGNDRLPMTNSVSLYNLDTLYDLEDGELIEMPT
jgi:hypothetical protein